MHFVTSLLVAEPWNYRQFLFFPIFLGVLSFVEPQIHFFDLDTSQIILLCVDASDTLEV